MDEDLEEITKDWSIDFFILENPAKMFEPKSPKTTQKEHETPRHNRMKKTEEIQDLSITSGKTTSVSPGRGGDDEVEEINGK
jgi:hypothetical protein